MVIYKIAQLSPCPCIGKLVIRPCPKLELPFQLLPLYGIIPVIRKVAINLGIQKNGLDKLEAEYGLQNLQIEGWLSEPILIDPLQVIEVETFADFHKEGHDILLLIGFVAEKLP